MVDNDCFNKFVDVGLARDLVVAFRDRHQGGSETDGQIIGVHHVLLTVVGQAVQKGKGIFYPSLLIHNIDTATATTSVITSSVCHTVNNTQDESLMLNVVVMNSTDVCVR